jgi:RNA polymerase sigma-70 factor, ECF subfamily
MDRLDEARRLARQIAGDEADLWTLPAAAVARAEACGRPLAEVVLDLVSGAWAVRARDGDEAARKALLHRWRGEVLRWCRWNVAAGVDAEDVAHDVLVRAVQRLHTLTRPDGFRPWLWAITWRVLREHERRPWRRWLGLADRDPPSEAALPSEALEEAQRTDQVQAVLRALDLEERGLLWHAYVDGRTRPQLAEIMGWSEGTVNRRLTEARARFREEAQRRGLHPLSEPHRVHR